MRHNVQDGGGVGHRARGRTTGWSAYTDLEIQEVVLYTVSLSFALLHNMAT